MPKAPVVSGRKLIKALEKLGFKQVRQRGSHVVLRKGDVGCVVPLHRQVALDTLRSALAQAEVTVDQLVGALK